MRAFLVAAAVLGGAFGSASGTLISHDGDVMVVDIEVEVLGAAESVVAHLEFDDDPGLTLPLLSRGEGIYGLVTELEAKNYLVVFERLGGVGAVSDPVSMADIGIDLLGEGEGFEPPSEEDEGLSTEALRNLWLAVALAAASLSALAFWVLGGRDGDEESDDAAQTDDLVRVGGNEEE